MSGAENRVKKEKKRLQAVYPWLIVLSCFCLQGGVLGIIHCCRGMFFDSLVERFKTQYVLGAAAAVMAGSQFVQAFFDELWQWYAVGAVQGLCYTVLIPTVPLLLQNWFHEKQGVVMGIAGASSGIVGAVMNGVGKVNDRWGLYPAFAFGLLVVAGGFASLLFGRSLAAGFTGAFIMGGPMSLSVILIPIWTTRLFGKKYYFQIYSLVSIVQNFFAAFGYLLFTGVHDVFGGYDAALAFGLVSGLVSLGILSAIRALEKRI